LRKIKTPISFFEIGGFKSYKRGIRTGGMEEIPKACRMGSQNPKINPTTPKQPQQMITTTTRAMIQGLVFLGEAAGGGGGVPDASTMDQ
jgi:hypothetical protein